MSEQNKKDHDPFSLAAGVPVAPVEGELVPKPKASIGMSGKVVGVIVAAGVVFMALFLAALDNMDQDKTKKDGESAKTEDARPNEDVAGKLPKDFQSTGVGAVNKPAALPAETPGGVVPPVTDRPGNNAAGNVAGTASGNATGSPAPTTSGPANNGTVVPSVGNNGIRVPPAGQNNGAPQLSPEELKAQKVRDERDSRLLQARLQGLDVKGYQDGGNGQGSAQGNSAGSTRADATRQRSDALINTMLNNLGGSKASAAGAGAAAASGFAGSAGLSGANAGSDQDEKLRFVNGSGNSGAASNGYLENTVMPPLSSSQLNAGAFIPSILEMAVNSELPGQVTARVRENVYASVNENCLLMPSGSQLVGTYSSKVSLGQGRQLVVWNRVFFPNGHELNLAGMSSADVSGQAGLEADVDNHLLRLFGMTLGMSLVTAGVQLSVGTPATSVNGVTAAATPAQTVSTSLSQQFGQLGGQLFGKYLNIQPTLRNFPGERFNVVVHKSIVFPKCYGR